MSLEIKATIIETLKVHGDRVYLLEIDASIGKSASVELSLVGHDEERYNYYYTQNETVVVTLHSCSDLPKGAYYAWQQRKPGKPSACPRCKSRIDRRNVR